MTNLNGLWFLRHMFDPQIKQFTVGQNGVYRASKTAGICLIFKLLGASEPLNFSLLAIRD